MNSKKKNIILYPLYIVTVALLLMLATRSSFLYVFNNWDDANSYFSVGKSLFNGKVPYRDVFDQKGMYLYFFYGLAYLVSHTSFLGVYLLEVIIGVLDVLGYYKILKLYISEKLSLILAPACFATLICARSFWWGGAAEEICLPAYVWGLYIILNYMRKDFATKTLDYKSIFIGGLLAGYIANIKFTGLGFFFGWMALVWFTFLLHKRFLDSIKACLIFLAGMFVPFIPWIIYFAAKGSLYDWYWGYVYINVFLYPAESSGLYDKFYQMAKILYWLIRDNWQYFVFIIVGLIATLFERGQKILSRLCAPILFGFLYLGIFIGGRKLPYYSIPLTVFAVLGFAFIGKLIDKIFEKKNLKTFLVYPLAIIFSMVFVYCNSMNIPFMKETKDDFFLFRFRDKVLETENPTLLNVGCLDAGLYTVTDIIPSCRWFQTQTLEIPEKENNPYCEQERYIREAQTDYVIAEVNSFCPPVIYDNYEVIDEETYTEFGYEFHFCLFKRK